MTRRQRLGRRKSPPAPLIEQGSYRFVPQTDRRFVNHKSESRKTAGRDGMC